MITVSTGRCSEPDTLKGIAVGHLFALIEDRGIAIDKAYLHGELKGGTDKATAVELPEGYIKAAKVVAAKQAALARYRLADELREFEW